MLSILLSTTRISKEHPDKAPHGGKTTFGAEGVSASTAKLAFSKPIFADELIS
jgi:hypothetical protein